MGINWFPHWRSIEAGGGYIKSVTLEDHEQALAEKDAEITRWKAAHDEMVSRNRLLRDRPDLPADRIRAHDEWVQKYSQLMEKAIRFAQQCVQPIRGKVAIQIADEAQSFLKEHKL